MPKKALTREDVVKRLLALKGDRPVSALAKDFDVSKAYMGQVLRGISAPGPSILEPLGLYADTPEVVYRELDRPLRKAS